MENSFVSFERFGQSNPASAWIPRVFSQRTKRSQGIPTDIDNSGLHILTSFAPWGSMSEMDLSGSTSSFMNVTDKIGKMTCRRKSNSADSLQINTISSDDASKAVESQTHSSATTILNRSFSNRSLHARSASLPCRLDEGFNCFLPGILETFTEQRDHSQIYQREKALEIGESHSVIFQGEGMMVYAVYIIEFQILKPGSFGMENKCSIKIKKRYSEFQQFYESLEKRHGIKLPAFPKKTILARFSTHIIQARLKRFIQLMEAIILDNELAESAPVLSFLGLDQKEENSLAVCQSFGSSDTFTNAMQL